MSDPRPDEPPKLREPDPPPPPTEPPVPAAVKSRAVGCCLLVGGAVLLALVPVIGVMPKKVLIVLLALGPVGLMMGLGMIVVPWTDEMFAMNDQEDLGKWWRSMTRFWKVWFSLSIAVMLAVMTACFVWL